jgi:hypothetical protein
MSVESPEMNRLAGFHAAQLETIERDKWRQTIEGQIERMRQHVTSCGKLGAGIACAILEMPEALRNQREDPYLAAKRALAMAGCLPQVVLNSASSRLSKEDDFPEKIWAAVGDLLRMLGVSPMVPVELTLAAIGRIKRDGTQVLDVRTESQVFPAAVQLRGNLFESKLLGQPKWMPYAKAVIQILSGEYSHVSWKREDRVATERFSAEVLEELNREGPALVLIESESSDLDTLNNGKLVFDSLTLAGRRFSTEDLSNLSVVRIRTDPGKLPAYFHDQGVSWASGLWDWGQERTFYGLKTKPPSAMRGALSARIGRGTGTRTDAKMRLTPQIDEICLVLKPEGVDSLTTARLVHKLRGCHVQYDYDTQRPFPLHETLRLAGSVTFSSWSPPTETMDDQ